MRIDVRPILIEDIGTSRSFQIEGEQPELEGVTLTKPIDGTVTLTKLEDSIQAEGQFETTIALECHRCLSTFETEIHHRFARAYTERPTDDELPIEAGQVDLDEAVRQEILVNLPIKLICRDDCPGIPLESVSQSS